MPMTIDILCKVVDNYGDIGVAFRLARALSALPEAPRLRLVVDGLDSFAALEPTVDPRLRVQEVRGWLVADWIQGDPVPADFEAEPPSVVIECFACGRPDWFEALLFDDERYPADARPRTVVNLEYLSAEPYADECHRLPSLTRSSSVRKHMFMPGFTEATGGLVMDGPFMASLERYAGEDRFRERIGLLSRLGETGALILGENVASRANDTNESIEFAANRFWVPLFSYERDYGPIVADLAAFGTRRPILVLAAAGKSQGCLLAAWEKAGRPFPLVRLPFLSQEAWDEVLAAADFSLVRGEDSWARAALAGRPFLWQAYPQADRHQMVKVEAFLERLRPWLGEQAIGGPLAAAYRGINDRLADSPSNRGSERLLDMLNDYDGLATGFADFAARLRNHGDLARNLMTFLSEIV